MADTPSFTTNRPDPNTFEKTNMSGTVDAKACLGWLKACGYDIDMKVQ
jgi:hypothetical protein